MASAMWPQPSSLTNGSNVIWMGDQVDLDCHGFGDESHSSGNISRAGWGFIGNSSASKDVSFIRGAFERFTHALEQGTYRSWKFSPRGTDLDPPTNEPNAPSVSISHITVLKSAPLDSNSTAHATTDESYSLDLFTNGSVVIKADSAHGAIYGLTTLSQLFYASVDRKYFTRMAPVSIQDKPRYAHRGLNMDISRNFEEPGSIFHLLDGMAYAKLNRLHLHATDSQAWPLEIPAMPELASKGAYIPRSVWTASDLKGVQDYAQQLGVETIIEINSPGHTASIAYSHPELIVGFNQQSWPKYCTEPPCGQVSLKSDDTYPFFDKLYADLLPRVAPYSHYFDSGGNEINANTYSLDPLVKSNDTTTIKGLLEPFVKHLHDIIRKQSMAPMVWEELITTWNLSLPTQDVLVQTRINQSSLQAVTEKGYQALFGDSEHWYLDYEYGSFVDPDPATFGSPKTIVAPPYTDDCSPQKSWRQVYSYNPTINLTEAQQSRLAGGEVHVWGELTDAKSLDGKVWPRAAAAAEIMWSGPSGPKGVVEAVTRRLADFRERLIGMGFQASVVQVTWCLQNQGSCFE